MSVFKRKTSAGYTEEYHYKFMQGGQILYGVCEGCFDEESAKRYEKNQRNLQKELSMQRNVKALVENFRDELAGGSKIFIADAFDLSTEKPRKRQPSSTQIAAKRCCWNDFVAYMKSTAPDVVNLSDVRKRHAEGYIQYISKNGKYNKEVLSRRSRQVLRPYRMSARTINNYHKAIREVFELLAEDSGITENPFAKIPMKRIDEVRREIFSAEELKLIMEQAPDFVREIFVVGFFTGMREGDICTLRWSSCFPVNNLQLPGRYCCLLSFSPPVRLCGVVLAATIIYLRRSCLQVVSVKKVQKNTKNTNFTI